MKNLSNKFLVSLLLVIITLGACHKEGEGGKASVSGMVKHHSAAIPNAVVYIKYGSSDFPGTEASRYDDQVTADASGHYEFSSLYKGSYYLYGVGYDNNIMEVVSGGVSVDLKKNKSYTLDVPVTE